MKLKKRLIQERLRKIRDNETFSIRESKNTSN